MPGRSVLAAAGKGTGNLAVPLHSFLRGALYTDPRALLTTHAVATRDLQVVDEAGRFLLVDADKGAAKPALGMRVSDIYRRLMDPTPSRGGEPLRVGLLAAQRSHRAVYPEELAALGDAADARPAATP